MGGHNNAEFKTLLQERNIQILFVPGMPYYRGAVEDVPMQCSAEETGFATPSSCFPRVFGNTFWGELFVTVRPQFCSAALCINKGYRAAQATPRHLKLAREKINKKCKT
eukprot:TRINITY_DN6672_c0_g1_i11.p3 TRINITY_DN6672_c0_g1~~TRINITY_DN6672_c0_g1_i11.p3  ORF type:complete len:109 (-),score=1.05 TRINITY_DN6672_c0_g1_i11:153-479(-)